jgi:putative flippase GtrA
MIKLHNFIKTFLLKWIDFFYPIFKKLMPLQTFRYASCGGLNTFFDILIYFISYNYILNKELVEIGFLAISPHIAAFIIAFVFSFPTGFYLNRYIVFQSSATKKRVQLIKYLLVVAICIGLNYGFFKILCRNLRLVSNSIKNYNNFLCSGI